MQFMGNYEATEKECKDGWKGWASHAALDLFIYLFIGSTVQKPEAHH